jgi:hypothetical protein
VRFRISRHSGFAAPADAVDLLWRQLGAKRDEASFAKVGSMITAEWGADAPVSLERDEREEIGRGVLLEIVGDVCERTPGLKSDWYAVSPFR